MSYLTGEAEKSLGAGNDSYSDDNDNDQNNDDDGNDGSGSCFYKKKNSFVKILKQRN